MPQHRRAHLVRQAGLQMHQRQRAQQPSADIDHHEQPEAGSQHGQQVMIVMRDRVIHGDLHIEWTRNDIGLQQHRQQQRLHHRRSAAARCCA